MAPKVAFGPLRSHLIHPWTVALPVTFHVSFAWRGNDHTSRAGSKRPVARACQVGASEDLGLAPVRASGPAGRLVFARFIKVAGPTANATKAEAPTRHRTIAAMVVRCIPILRVAEGLISRSDIWRLLDGHETFWLRPSL